MYCSQMLHITISGLLEKIKGTWKTFSFCSGISKYEDKQIIHLYLTIRALLAPRDALFLYTIFAQGQIRALLAPCDALFFYTIFAQG